MAELWGMCAVDAGPKSALEPLTSSYLFAWISMDGEETALDRCECWLERNAACGLVVGTSRSRNGGNIEQGCSSLAKAKGRVVVAVEDYPGNGKGLGSSDVDVLVVECTMPYEDGVGYDLPVLQKGASMRYDILRTRLLENRMYYKENRSRRRSGGIVLWIGQPETSACITTLSRILVALEISGLCLLFKAHPRDVGYAEGVYEKLFAQYSVVVTDVSKKTLVYCFSLAPDLVLTHFSSCAIEAGFFGIPSVHVLYPDAGQQVLNEMCGYSQPPICRYGGSLVVNDTIEQDRLIEELVRNESFRQGVLGRFDEFYDVNTLQAEKVIANILAYQA